MCLSCTVSEISAKRLHLAHRIWGDLGQISRRSLAPKKLESLSYRAVCLCDPMFSRFSRTLTCDRQTQGHSIYCASTASASRGKKHATKQKI